MPEPLRDRLEHHALRTDGPRDEAIDRGTLERRGIRTRLFPPRIDRLHGGTTIRAHRKPDHRTPGRAHPHPNNEVLTNRHRLRLHAHTKLHLLRTRRIRRDTLRAEREREQQCQHAHRRRRVLRRRKNLSSGSM